MKQKNKEIWMDVPEYEGYYEASNEGRVRGLDRTVLTKNGERFLKGKIMEGSFDNKGYKQVTLSRDGKTEQFRIHQLVAVCFLNHTPDGHQLIIDHRDGDRSNNNVENLRIVTPRQNLSTCYRANEGSFTSKFVGVCYNKQTNKWQASIYYNEIQIHLGFYNNEEKASNAYQKALDEINDNTFNPENYKPKWTSRFKGVSWHKQTKKWVAQIQVKNKKIFLGRFENELEASDAYQKTLSKVNDNTFNPEK